MSLQLIFGNSGSGKSGYLYERILEQAEREPDRNFLILVPEQFTMQTQRELVGRQKNHAIMNVDVLSFARLAYRVFDELGMQDVVVLEDTGKNLVLRKVAELKKKELKVLGGSLNKMGYVDQIKSLITELTQYNIAPEDLAEFLETEKLGAALEMKMQDVLTMYRGFREYLAGKYITSEEVLSLLCEVAQESAMLRDSVIVFDEFTGFTPVQNRLMRKLMELADKMIVSVTMDIREDFYHSRGMHELFAMSKKTVETLTRMAMELSAEIEEPVILGPGKDKRYKNAPDLFFMEQNLFRPASRKWENKPENISITGLKNPREELNFTAREITRLVRRQGYCYKDIALVTGDVPQYANYVPEIFEQYGIPYFIDQTRNILFHPFIEFVRAALEVVEQDFSYESVFRFLRTGLAKTILLSGEKAKNEAEAGRKEAADLTEDDIDRLENYVLARGIRGRKRWREPWTFVAGADGTSDGTKEDFLRMNHVRESIYLTFEPLLEVFGQTEHTVAEQTYALYDFISSLKIAEQLKERETAFEEAGNPARAKEYAQIYKIVMELLEKVCALLGEEKISVREYGDILDAGFSAAKVGIIPPGNDRVTIGDIERTRLNHVKVLFFVGVNDGVVPKSENHGSIISQFERESITAHHLELAPGAREKVFIQKFYLYLNMTKPSDALYVTFSAIGSDGKAKRRSYLIGTLQKMFPKLAVREIEELHSEEDLMTPESALRFLMEGLQKKGEIGESFRSQAEVQNQTQEENRCKECEDETDRAEKKEQWKALANWYLSHEAYQKRMERLLEAAFFHHTEEPIGRAVTKALYGTVLENSVTRLERFAACAFSHYLRYGLQLKERELQQFASVDMGNIYHDALEYFAKRVENSEYTWFTLPADVQAEWVEESLSDAILGCGNAAAFEEPKSRYLLERVKTTLRRTVWALITQVQKGHFVPSDFEVSFSQADDLEAVNFSLSEQEKMRLRGRIDRVDTYESENKVYVKIIDYKSGSTSFSLLNIYHGLQLQLVVYMNAALELTAKKHPDKEVEPAGIFYYHIQDPMVDGTGTESEEEIRQAVLEQLKLNGVVNEEREVYRAMDADFSGNSSVIPVGEKTDGSLKASAKTVSTKDFRTMSDYVNRTLVEAGREILNGAVDINPYQLDSQTGCDYCPYHTVCSFDARIPGFSYRKLEKIEGSEVILERMCQAEEPINNSAENMQGMPEIRRQ